MELGFDKEMDALLRRAGKDEVPETGPSGQVHLDADAFAAFAENALPEKTRRAYMLHLADCGRCRKILSQSIALKPEAVPETVSSPALAPAIETRIPWYRRLFTAPNLAYVMGGLILVFAGFLGYSVLFNRPDRLAEVSQVPMEESRTGGPSVAGEPLPATTNTTTTAANTAADTAPATAANTASNAANTPTRSAANSNTAAASSPRTPSASDASSLPSGTGTGAGAPQEKPAVAVAAEPAPPPKPAPPIEKDKEEAAAAAKEEKRAEDEQARADNMTVKRAPSMDRGRALRSVAGPKVQQQQQSTVPYAAQQNQASAERRIAGKTFEQKQGVWYDSTYQGQRTINVRRGTDDYKKLDPSLRSIAENLGGTIVVVWNNKAFRIQ